MFPPGKPFKPTVMLHSSLFGLVNFSKIKRKLLWQSWFWSWLRKINPPSENIKLRNFQRQIKIQQYHRYKINRHQEPYLQHFLENLCFERNAEKLTHILKKSSSAILKTKWKFYNTTDINKLTSWAVFTTLHFLCILWMAPIR